MQARRSNLRLAAGMGLIFLAALDFYIAEELAKKMKADHDAQPDPTAPITTSSHGSVKAGFLLSLFSTAGLFLTGLYQSLNSCGFFARSSQAPNENSPLISSQQEKGLGTKPAEVLDTPKPASPKMGRSQQ